MRLIRSALLGAMIISGTALSSSVIAAPAPTKSTLPAPAAKEKENPLIASVNGEKIYLNDVRQAAANLPPQLQRLPVQTIIGALTNQMISQKAVQIAAERDGLAKKPEVKAMMENAANSALQNAYLSEKVRPMVTDAAIQQAYQKDYEAHKNDIEIHARHILVATEAQAKDAIAQLKKGANFADLAKKLSTDKGTGASGGDLGWFKKTDMLPAFSDAAFKMKPNTVSQTPVKTQYGWHVIKVLGSRKAKVPPLNEVREEIRQQLVREDVQKVVQNAMSQVKIVHYDDKGNAVAPTKAK
ncbi:peptidylprolyl isomerase [Candidatus Kirkpatrickella diaphorinae]|uniref:Parvulin-like PPIase n=1 Tax=Candidatus Kirkpatrickella diaphorinae TaxID=2984322 RepID=A0ABY6GI44_9PROT|nr:peptidylprolyl isomerase [Candidatus Kirkpatrickella diaphorinae]UYH50530.1 peptidylprolyl isomerase [Candidatus Kirkpatrickella diaphorinae]